MVQPYNYLMAGGGSPIEAALGGLRIGASLAEMEEARAARVAKEQAALKKEEQERLLNEERSKLISGPLTRENMFRLAQIGASKEQREMAQSAVNQMTQEQQRASASRYGQLVSAAIVGNQPVFNEVLNNSIQAETNPAGRQALQTIQKLASTMGPDAGQKLAKVALGEMLNAGGEYRQAAEQLIKIHGLEFGAAEDLRKKTADARIAEAQANLAPQKFAAELGLNQAQIDQARAAQRAQDAAAAASGAEAERAKAEAEQMARGVIPVEKRPEAESKLRAEYNNQTAVYRDVRSSYARVLASEETAAGDISLVFGFMKMLDPGSVVREGEFATAENAGGVPDRVLNLYNRLRSGERLNPDQRNMFKSQARSLFDQAAKDESKVRSGLSRIATGYGLNLQNIFYAPGEEAPTAPGQMPPTTGATGARSGAAPLQGPPQGTATVGTIGAGRVGTPTLTTEQTGQGAVSSTFQSAPLAPAGTTTGRATTTATRVAPVRVTVNGRTFEFPTQEAADRFRAAAGVR